MRVAVILGAALALLAAAAEPDATVVIDLHRVSSWRIDPQLFGSFYEEHWGDVTPGVYEQYLVNPSFEPWYRAPGENKTRVVFPVPAAEGVAYPWEPYPNTGAAVWSASGDRVNSEQSQRIDMRGGAAGGVTQRLALPDYRLTRFRLHFWARAEGSLTLRAVFLNGAAGAGVLDVKPVRVTTEWAAYGLELDLGGRLQERHLNRFGVARLGLLASGDGSLFLDQATLFPTDCVDRVYNPETLENVRKFGPTAIRWPGGNYTSGYHWMDGIGEIGRRPTRPNRAWGGSEPNHVGTDEWLRFCERAGLEPVMGVGFGEITAEEAAGWVEYCNGPVSTKMGALRAANGHPEPYRVRYWGVGNEVYGGYQIGHTDAATYARALREMARVMRARDPSIRIVAVGLGVHNDYRRQARDWNRTVLDIAGDAIDLLDVHYYVYGPDASRIAAAGRAPVERAMFGASGRLAAYYGELRKLLAVRPGIGVVHYEWGVLPRAATLGMSRQSFLNALCTAEQYHTFFRNGDLLRGAMLHNFSYYVNPVAGHSEPPNPRSYLSQLYRTFAGSHVVETHYDGPVDSVAADYPEIGPLQDVPEIDSIAVQGEDGTLRISLLNRNPDRDFEVLLSIPELKRKERTVEIQRFESSAPSQLLTWFSDNRLYTVRVEQLAMSSASLPLRVNRTSIVHLWFRL
jgi:alpha-N-arabinofuranosidase